MSAPLWYSRVCELGSHGGDVAVAQRVLGLIPTGVFDVDTAMALRGLQVRYGLDPTGELDAATAEAIGPRAADVLMPSWWHGTPLLEGEPQYALVAESPSWLRRLQGNHSLTPTGVIDAATALILGAMEVDT